MADPSLFPSVCSVLFLIILHYSSSYGILVSVHFLELTEVAVLDSPSHVSTALHYREMVGYAHSLRWREKPIHSSLCTRPSVGFCVMHLAVSRRSALTSRAAHRRSCYRSQNRALMSCRLGFLVFLNKAETFLMVERHIPTRLEGSSA